MSGICFIPTVVKINKLIVQERHKREKTHAISAEPSFNKY